MSAKAAVVVIRRNLAAKAGAEAMGTFAIVLFGCGAAPGAAPLAFGLTVATMIYALGHISGAHFNPAVSLGFAISRQFPWREVPAYWVAQLCGATAASAVLSATFPSAVALGVTVPTVPLGIAFTWELVLTFFLMFVIISVATDARAVGIMAGAAIGGMVGIAALVGGPLTGASMNPARSFGPALVNDAWSRHWLYLVAPMLGAVAAALVYRYVRCEPEDGPKSAKGCC